MSKPTELELSLYDALERVMSEARHVQLTLKTEEFVERVMYDYQMTYGEDGAPERRD